MLFHSRKAKLGRDSLERVFYGPVGSKEKSSHKAASMVSVSKVTSQAEKEWGYVPPKVMVTKGKAEIV